MPVDQLPESCWVISWPGDDRTKAGASLGAHYATEEGARRPDGSGMVAIHKDCNGVVVFGIGAWCLLCEQDISDDEWERRFRRARRLKAPCWGVTCNGCGSELADEDDGDVHEDTREKAAGAADYHGWTVAPDDATRCPGCAAPAAPSEQEATR